MPAINSYYVILPFALSEILNVTSCKTYFMFKLRRNIEFQKFAGFISMRIDLEGSLEKVEFAGNKRTR